ncbi:MAG: penicillin-binding transpeptidase domain-containing protein [Candidatus Wallbacteria bacterium]|nr:penicillin-binding transpeptidase domain-containing protein [Candidatus Wallbacteria bacterium]
MKKRVSPFISLPRLLIFLIAMNLSFIIIYFRLYQLQIIQHDKWLEFGKNEYSRSLKISKRRGDIFDVKLNKLATSEPVYSVFIDPKDFSTWKPADRKKFLELYAPAIGTDPAKLQAKLDSLKRSRFYWLKRQMTDEQHEALAKTKFEGVFSKREYARRYPEKYLAGQLLGFVGMDDMDILDNKGLEGLEYRYNDIIAGKFIYSSPDQEAKLDEDQSPSIVLTIDSVIQNICETALESACTTHEAVSGQILVMEPKTGRILAMANFPYFDPNNYHDYSPNAYKNHIVTDLFEPGSTFKPVAMSGALTENCIQLDETFHCDGSFMVPGDPGKPIRCLSAHGDLIPSDIIAFSCNPGISQVALQLGEKNLYKFIEAFGFLDPSFLKLPGEMSSLVIPWEKWYKRDLASISFGNAIAVTGLSLTRAFCVFANQGILMEPMLLEKILNSRGETIQEFKPQIEHKVLEPEIAGEIMQMLESVIAKGSGKRASIQGYKIAGKTGTPQIAGVGGYTENKYLSIFIGIAPSDNPRILSYIQIAEPNPEKSHTGGYIAAPVFAEIAEKILRYLEIFPILPKTIERPAAEVATVPLLTPNFVGLSLKEVEMERKSSTLKFKLMGDGDLVIFQLPRAGSPVSENVDVNLYLGERSLYEKLYSKGHNTMPNFIGKTLKEVVNLLKDWENPIQIKGHGMVEFQIPPGGTKITPTSEIEIRLSSASERNDYETQGSSGEVSTTEVY